MLRFIIGGEIKSHSAEYEPYLYLYNSVQDFISREVDVIDHQADFLQMIALTRYLEVRVCIIEVTESSMRILHLPEDASGPVIGNFLFIPGHYDLLYNY